MTLIIKRRYLVQRMHWVEDGKRVTHVFVFDREDTAKYPRGQIVFDYLQIPNSSRSPLSDWLHEQGIPPSQIELAEDRIANWRLAQEG